MNILTLECKTGNFLNSDGSIAGNFRDFLDPTGGQAEFCKDYVSTSSDLSKPSIFANNGPVIYNDGRWENTNPSIVSNQTINSFITKAGDKICCYTSFSIPADIVFPKDTGYSEYKTKLAEYQENSGDTSFEGVVASIGKVPFDYFGIVLDSFRVGGAFGSDGGFVAFDYTKYGGTYDTWASGSKKLHLKSGIEQFGEGIHVDVNAFGESEQRIFVKHVLECLSFSDKPKTGKLTTKLYSSGGVELAENTKSFTFSGSNIEWKLSTVDSYNHFIVPGLKWHQVVISTDDLNIKEFLPGNYRKYLDGDGLRIAWGIQKSWTVSKITEHSGNSDIHVNDSDRARWDAKSEFSGNYDDLEGKPIITNIDASALTDDEIKTILEL